MLSRTYPKAGSEQITGSAKRFILPRKKVPRVLISYLYTFRGIRDSRHPRNSGIHHYAS
jgi:hypothetical protein